MACTESRHAVEVPSPPCAAPPLASVATPSSSRDTARRTATARRTVMTRPAVMARSACSSQAQPPQVATTRPTVMARSWAPRRAQPPQVVRARPPVRAQPTAQISTVGEGSDEGGLVTGASQAQARATMWARRAGILLRWAPRSLGSTDGSDPGSVDGSGAVLSMTRGSPRRTAPIQVRRWLRRGFLRWLRGRLGGRLALLLRCRGRRILGNDRARDHDDAGQQQCGLQQNDAAEEVRLR